MKESWVAEGEFDCYRPFTVLPLCFQAFSSKSNKQVSSLRIEQSCLSFLNSLPDMPILGSSKSAVNRNMMSQIWTNGDTII